MWLYDGNLDEVREREERALFVMFQQNIADLTEKPRLNKTFLIDNWYILWHIPIWVWHIQFPWNIKREWNYQSEVIRRKVQHHRRWLRLRNALWGFKVHSRGNQSQPCSGQSWKHTLGTTSPTKIECLCVCVVVEDLWNFHLMQKVPPRSVVSLMFVFSPVSMKYQMSSPVSFHFAKFQLSPSFPAGAAG